MPGAGTRVLKALNRTYPLGDYTLTRARQIYIYFIPSEAIKIVEAPGKPAFSTRSHLVMQSVSDENKKISSDH